MLLSEKYDVVIKTNAKRQIKGMKLNNNAIGNQAFAEDLYNLIKKHNMSFTNMPATARAYKSEEN